MIYFHKYEGAGNDFIMINNLDGKTTLTIEQIKHFCNRNFGIGADGVILLEQSDKADCFMNYYNSDGTQAEMCGNGVRCTAKFLETQTDMSKARPYSITIDTRAGIKSISVNEDETCSVNMGLPMFESPDFPSESLSIGGVDYNCVSMGNPHTVTFVDDIKNVDLKLIGPKIENNFNFPNKINVEFVQKISPNYYKVKVWERGCGATLACGTGACAVYATIQRRNKIITAEYVFEEITLEFPGGNLFLSENKEKEIVLRGPATFVFKGEI